MYDCHFNYTTKLKKKKTLVLGGDPFVPQKLNSSVGSLWVHTMNIDLLHTLVRKKKTKKIIIVDYEVN